MGISSNVTEQDLINLRKLAEQQEKQCAIKIKNRNSKQTHDKELAENLSPISKKLDIVKESTKKLGEILEKSNVEDENTQTPAMKIISGTQLFRDTLTL